MWNEVRSRANSFRVNFRWAGSTMPVTIRYKLDDLMKEYRRRHPDTTWKDVAEATGISQQLLSNLRHTDGQVVTNLAYIASLCCFFGKAIEKVVEIGLPADAEEIHV